MSHTAAGTALPVPYNYSTSTSSLQGQSLQCIALVGLAVTKLCNTKSIYVRGTTTTVKILPSLSYPTYYTDGLLFISDLRDMTCFLLALLILVWFSLQWSPS